jgi:hypothetical protein
VAVCLELAKGPLVYALQKHEFLVLFPVNPATGLARPGQYILAMPALPLTGTNGARWHE